mgnify:CR=1 FL=1
MGIESGICKIRRDIQKEGHFLYRAKLALTSEKAKTIGKITLAVAVIAAAAYVSNRRAYNKGVSYGFDAGFWIGEIYGSANASSSWRRHL